MSRNEYRQRQRDLLFLDDLRGEAASYIKNVREKHKRGEPVTKDDSRSVLAGALVLALFGTPGNRLGSGDK